MSDKIKSYKSGDIVKFGKYKDQTIDYVMQFDPSYIEWMKACKLCDEKTVERMNRGQFKKRKLKDGHAIVF